MDELVSQQSYHLALKYENLYSKFLVIDRQENFLSIIQDGFLWRTLYDLTDFHISYPANGHVHYTLRKDKVYAVHIFKKWTTITHHTESWEPQDLPDFNALALKSQPLKLLVKDGPPLNEFTKKDIYALPTTSFVVQPDGIRRVFQSIRPGQKYGEPIDLSNYQNHIINFHIFLMGSLEAARKVTFDIEGTKIMKRIIVGERAPFIQIVMQAGVNQG